jgi:hypothetical protein
VFLRLSTIDLHGVAGKLGNSPERNIEAVLSVLDEDAKLILKNYKNFIFYISNRFLQIVD